MTVRLTIDQQNNLKTWLRSRGWTVIRSSMSLYDQLEQPGTKKLFDFQDAIVIQACCENFPETT